MVAAYFQIVHIKIHIFFAKILKYSIVLIVADTELANTNESLMLATVNQSIEMEPEDEEDTDNRIHIPTIDHNPNISSSTGNGNAEIDTFYSMKNQYLDIFVRLKVLWCYTSTNHCA